MAATQEQLFALFDDLGIEHETVTHPPLFTVEDGRDWWDKIPGLHCKNLFLKDKKDRLWLFVTPGHKRTDIGALEKRIGAARLSFGKPDLLLEVLKLTPGSVTPFGLINDTHKRVTVVLDSDLMKSEWLNFHPLHNTASTTIRAVDLLKFLKRLGYQPLLDETATSPETIGSIGDRVA
ncbi:MAG: prolyl-tRNA synthetase associated domain-containing protein [Pseudomonadota bacterium]|nr:prolyl-tRNA synthetase associated domain-containing protein [Pseudomonadota bacterium]